MKTNKRAGKLSGAINALIRAKPLIGIIINLAFLSLRLGRISIFQFAQATQTKAQDHLWDRVAIRLFKAWAMNLRRGEKELTCHLHLCEQAVCKEGIWFCKFHLKTLRSILEHL